MKTRSYFIGKIPSLFLLAVLTLCICTPVLAESDTTILTTTVPSHFKMNVTIVGKGTIEINGQTLLETGVIQVERNSENTIIISPDQGFYLNAVIFDGEDITNEIKDGAFTFPALERDSSLSITFNTCTNTPNTGDNCNLFLFIVVAVASFIGIVVLLTINRKKL